MPSGDRNGRAARTGVWQALRGVLRWWLVAPLVLLAGYLIALAYTEAVVRGKLDEIKAKGEPLRLAEMAPKLPLGADNAADLYLQAFGFMWQGANFEQAMKDLSYARSILPQAEPIIELLEEASRMQTCAFPVDWNAPAASLVFPHYARMREGARLLNAHARVLGADGKSDEALGDVAAMCRMAEHVKSDPVLIALLLGYAIEGIAFDALEATLSAGDPSPETCRKLFDQLAKIDHRGAVRRAFLAERAFGIGTFQGFRAGDPATVQSFFNSIQTGGGPTINTQAAAYSVYRTIGRPILNLDEASYLDYMRAEIDSLTAPPAAPSHQWSSADPSTGLGLLGALIAPVMDRTKLNAQRREAEIAVARAALALKAYHAEKKRYAKSLAELAADGWKLPKDPFGGADLRYRAENHGFVVYSLGPNLADDNAAEFRRGMSWEDGPYDVVLRVKR
jgi:hypothetical protein